MDWRYGLLIAGLIVLAGVTALALASLLSKRPTNLGVKDGKLAPCPASPNCVWTQADDLGHKIDPIPFTGSAAQVCDRLKAILATQPRCRLVTETDTYLHAEFTSLLFRFVDDVEFLIDEQARLIHFRSASRAGRSDFGVNRARMENIRRAFQAVGPL